MKTLAGSEGQISGLWLTTPGLFTQLMLTHVPLHGAEDR